MESILLVRYGEIALKGKNMMTFEKKLVSNIKAALRGSTFSITHQHGRIYIHYNKGDEAEIIEKTTRVFGIVSLSPVLKVENDMAEIEQTALSEMKRLVAEKGIKTFKVETRRANKSFPMQSPEICRHLGGFLLDNIEGLKVDVNHPDITLNVEIRNTTYVFSDKIPCLGGMPYGSAGKGMILLSGGIDSPVAAYMVSRRGLEIEAVHFHSYPFTSERALEKVVDLAKKLTTYTRNVRIHSVNILEIQKAINENCPSEEMTILSRCFMMKIAEKIALNNNCKCLVTGENMGQVASQTIEGLTVTNSMVALPVIRPLIAYDKNEIIDVARRIDTFETSILPFEDCCTVFLPDKVVTKPRLEKIEKSLGLLDVDQLVNDAIDRMEVIIVKEA